MSKNHWISDYDSYLAELLKDPKAKKYYDECGRQLELAYKILQMRKKEKMSQKEFAKKIGTTQSNVARMEAGNQNFTLATLEKIAKVFDCELKINFTRT